MGLEDRLNAILCHVRDNPSQWDRFRDKYLQLCHNLEAEKGRDVFINYVREYAKLAQYNTQ